MAPEYPSWVPKSINEWLEDPENSSGETWIERINAVINCAKTEMRRLKHELKISKVLIRGHENELEKLVKELREKNRILTEENNRSNNTFLASFINEMNSKVEDKNRTEDKNKIKVLRELLLAQKEKTTKVFAEKRETIHNYDLTLSELNLLKLSYKDLEKDKETIMREKEEIKKRFLSISDEKVKSDLDCAKVRKRLQEEVKTTDELKFSLRTLAQQLNIPVDLLF